MNGGPANGTPSVLRLCMLFLYLPVIAQVETFQILNLRLPLSKQ